MSEKFRALCVDDEPAVRELFGAVVDNFQMLTGVETEVFTADNAVSGLNLALREQVDFVLSDVNMPGGSGPFMLKGLLNGASSPEIAFMSGGDVSEEDAMIIEYMMSDPRMLGMVKKPFDLERIRSLLVVASIRKGVLETGGVGQLADINDISEEIADETSRACQNYGIAVGGRAW